MATQNNQFQAHYPNPDYLLTRDQVEREFGIPKRFLEVADLKGIGPRQVRLGRSVRYRVQDIRDWIEASVIDGRSSGRSDATGR